MMKRVSEAEEAVLNLSWSKSRRHIFTWRGSNVYWQSLNIRNVYSINMHGISVSTVGYLDKRSHWLHVINLMEYFQVLCASLVVSCQHLLESESGR